MISVRAKRLAAFVMVPILLMWAASTYASPAPRAPWMARLVPRTRNASSPEGRLPAPASPAQEATTALHSEAMSRYLSPTAYAAGEQDHAGWKQLRKFTANRLRTAIVLSALRGRRLKVVEMGTGPDALSLGWEMAHLAPFLKRFGKSRLHVTGVELDENSVKSARSVAADAWWGKFADFSGGNIITFRPTKRADRFHAHFAWTDIPEEERPRALQNIKDNVLRPGGRFLMSEEVLSDGKDKRQALAEHHLNVILHNLLEKGITPKQLALMTSVAAPFSEIESGVPLAGLEFQAFWSGLHDLGDHKATLSKHQQELTDAGFRKIKTTKVWPRRDDLVAEVPDVAEKTDAPKGIWDRFAVELTRDAQRAEPKSPNKEEHLRNGFRRIAMFYEKLKTAGLLRQPHETNEAYARRVQATLPLKSGDGVGFGVYSIEAKAPRFRGRLSSSAP